MKVLTLLHLKFQIAPIMNHNSIFQNNTRHLDENGIYLRLKLL